MIRHKPQNIRDVRCRIQVTAMRFIKDDKKKCLSHRGKLEEREMTG